MSPTSENLIVTITDLAYGGDGVGHLPDGMAVFVPFTAIGDEVEIEITERQRRFAGARVVQLIKPSPDRVEPECPYYGDCGGCCFQHLSAAAEVQVKLRQVQQMLGRVGKIKDAPLPELIAASPKRSGYRNKITLHPMRGNDGHIHYGFMRFKSRDVVAIRQCLLAADSLNNLIRPAARSRLGRKNETALHPRPLTLRVDAEERTEFFFGRAPRRIPWMRERLDPETLHRVPLGGFSQVNPQVSSALISWLREQIRREPLELLVDAYCGSGAFALAGASFVPRVFGIEQHADSILAAIHNAEQLALKNLTFIAGDVEEHLYQPLDTLAHGERARVLLDPPRGGCRPPVIKQLLQARPAQIFYISCDPATLARDLARLQPAYQLREVVCFDMFPMTAHIESVAILDCRD